MLTVENVTKNAGKLSADYYYSDPTDRGHVVLDSETGKVLSKKYNREDIEYDGIYTFSKVVNFLRKMIYLNKFPSRATYMWY